MPIRNLVTPIIILTLGLSMSCTSPESSQSDQVITLLSISGVQIPVTGEMPVTLIADTTQYSGTIIWSPLITNTFASSTEYTAQISINPKPGYTLNGISANSFIIKGSNHVTHSADSGIVTAIFPATNSLPKDRTISSFSILGLSVPVVGSPPVTFLTSNPQYKGTVMWSPQVNRSFDHNTMYTAQVSLIPEPGYTLTGVAANSFSVSGALYVTNSKDLGVITVVFPPTCSFYLNMVSIPPGRFQRDTTANNISVISKPYKMSTTEITREQFQTIMGTDPSFTSYSSSTRDPVQSVSWYYAITFCNKLSIVEGLNPVYNVNGITDWANLMNSEIPTTRDTNWDEVTANWSANGYCLPTEMEWIWAAMGAPSDGQGTGTNITGYTKAFAGSLANNSIDDYAWHMYNSGGPTHPVGTKKPNELGLYDISGNVYEWCWDWHALYPNGTLVDYKGAPFSNSSRIIRGGSAFNEPECCNIIYVPYSGLSYEHFCSPYLSSIMYGFRVVQH